MSTKKKIIWIFVSCLMVLSLVIASCGPKAEEKEKVEEEEEGVVITTKEAEKEVVAEKKEVVPSDVPKYGGTIIEVLGMDITNWANGLEFC